MRTSSAPPELRLALFSGGYNCAVDGAVKVLNRLVAYLEARDVPVVIFSPTVKNPPFKHAGRLVPVPSFPLPFRPEYRIASGLTPAARRELEAFKPTILHVTVPDLLGLSALRASRRINCPVVGSYHTRFDTYCRYYHMGWLEPHMVRYLRYFYNCCEQIYAPSAAMAKILQEQGVGREVKAWSRGVDRELFNPSRRDMEWRRSLGIGDDEVVLTFVGRLVLEKGLQHFAKVHDLLAARGVAHRFLVVGEGPARSKIEGWAPDAILTGFLDGEDLARAYASSDIFFNPSITEAFGNVTIEAMASGTPPVCSRTAGHLSMINQGVTGFLCDADSVEEAADRISRLIQNSALRDRVGRAARTESRRFSWESVMDAIHGYYLDVVRGRAAQTGSMRALPDEPDACPERFSRTGT